MLNVKGGQGNWLTRIFSRSGRGDRGLGGSPTCRCPQCGYSTPHIKGTPCSSLQCPRCGAFMRGEHC